VGQCGQDCAHDHLREPGRLRNAHVVDCSPREHGQDCERAHPARCRVAPERQRHRCAARELSDDDAPACQKAPELAEACASIDIGSTGFGVHGGELCRGCGVAIRHQCSEREGDDETIPRRQRCGPERGEHPCANHRPETDDHRIDRPETPRQRVGASLAAVTSTLPLLLRAATCRRPIHGNRRRRLLFSSMTLHG